MTNKTTIRCFAPPAEPRYCHAVIDNTAARCGATPEHGRKVCTRCRVRIHSAMASTLDAHGKFGLADELNTLYRSEYGGEK